MMNRKFTSGVIIALVIMQFISLFANFYPAYAATTVGSSLKPERGDNSEYYYYDGDEIYGAGGQYPEPVKFVKKFGDNIYVPDGDTMNIHEIRQDADQCEDSGVPTKLWSREEQSEKEPAFFLNITLKGSAELDLKDDKEDGVFRWGKISDHTIKRIHMYDEEFPSSISGGTLAKDHTQVIDLVQIQNADVTCAYWYFKHFNRLVAPYDDDTLELGPLAGKILGRQGTPFNDYVKKADNRLRYRAYSQEGRLKTLEHCNRQPQIYSCINDVNEQFRKCYADAIKAGGANLEEDANDVLSGTWQHEFNPQTFVDCFKGASALYSDPKNYFTDESSLKDFAQSIVDDAKLPPSIRPADPDPVAQDEANDDTQGSIGMLGWILCPVFSFVAAINDQIFGILKNWLVLAPFQQGAGGSNAAAYDTWSKLRNIVNSLFIIFFIVLIYSQVTGRGITSYGVRALLPRIIIGALLVNMSYLICSLAVDISNSLGDSIYRLMSGMRLSGAQVGSGALDGGWENVTASLILGGGAIAGTIALIANLSALVPIMVMAFVALVTTFLVLLLRQALIIILVAASPFAFLLFVLPNTASWFSKWRSLFTQLLLLYPAFALIFAGSQITAEIVRDTAAVNGDTLLTIFSLGIQVIPLFLLPLLMKLGGGVLNRFGGIVNNTNKGPFDRMRKRADELRSDRKVQQQNRALNGRKGALGYGTFIRASQRNKAKHQYHAQNARRAAGSYTSQNQDDVLRSALGSSAGKNLKDQLKDVLRDNIDKELREEYEAALVSIENSDMSLDTEGLKDMAKMTGDHGHVDPGEQAAAMHKVLESGDIASIDDMLSSLHASQGDLTDLQREVVMKAAGSLSSGAAHLSAANVERTLNTGVPAGKTFSQALYANAAAHGAYTPEAMTTQDADSIKGMAASLSSEELATVKLNFAAAKSDGKLSGRMTSRTRNAGDRLP